LGPENIAFQVVSHDDHLPRRETHACGGGVKESFSWLAHKFALASGGIFQSGNECADIQIQSRIGLEEAVPASVMKAQS